jgi:mannose-6-phosphate isomerase
MFVGLTNTPRDYAWGSTTAIAALLGRTPSGRPEAEYWLGTHPGSPARLTEPEVSGGATLLSQLTTLPFLLKVLAADAPLSLQAHPTAEQAWAGFARENALGIPVDAPERNYRDALPKPELIFALSEEFVALCGFRAVAGTRALLDRISGDPVIDAFRQRLVGDDALRGVFEWLISRAPGVDDLVARVVARAKDDSAEEFRMVGELAAAYPGDPGIVIALLLNRVVLSPGEALYLRAGNIHAYLRGVGIELMAASDNVLRGGLTPKHVDVDELLSVLDFRAVEAPLLLPEEPGRGLRIYRPDVPEFELAVIQPDAGAISFTPTGEALLLCTNGEVTVVGAVSQVGLARGESVYVSADEGALEFAGTGTVFVATRNAAR